MDQGKENARLNITESDHGSRFQKNRHYLLLSTTPRAEDLRQRFRDTGAKEMTREEILRKILAFLDEKSAAADQPISDSELLDSLTVLEMVMFLEQEFGLTFNQADLEALRAPESIADLIVRKQSDS